MDKIIAAVGTPLQLAALIVLLAALSGRYLLRSGTVKFGPGLTRLLIDRGFALVMVVVVLVLVLPAVVPLIPVDRDQTYYGAVRSPTGPVAGATVELLTITSATTNSLGQFDVVVPHNRLQPSYRVQVSAPGFKTSEVVERSAAQMRSLELQLEPQPRELVREMEQPLLLGAFFGVPFAIPTLRVENPTASIVVISDIRATLTGPGVTYGLSPVAWTIAGQWGPYAPVSGPIPIFAGAQLDLRVMLALPTNLNQLYAQMATLPEYQSQRPCTGPPGTTLSDDGLAVTRRFAADRFAWAPGPWALHLEVVAENKVRSFDARATLSEAEVATLRNAISLARQCLGVNLGAPLGQDGPLANFVLK